MANDERETGSDYGADGGIIETIEGSPGSDHRMADESSGTGAVQNGGSAAGKSRKRGRPKRDVGSDSAGDYVIAADVGRKAKTSKDAPHDLRHATALLANLTTTAAKFSNIPAVKLEVSECELLVKAIDEFIRVWFPNAGKKIFDEKTSSAIALGFAVVSILGARLGASMVKDPAPSSDVQSEPEIDWQAMSNYNVATI